MGWSAPEPNHYVSIVRAESDAALLQEARASNPKYWAETATILDAVAGSSLEVNGRATWAPRGLGAPWPGRQLVVRGRDN